MIAGGHSAPWRFGHRESPWPIFPEGSVPSSELAPWCAEVPAPTAAAGSEMGLSQPPLLPPSLPAPSTTLSAVVHRSRGDTSDLPTPASSQVEFKARWVRIIDPSQILNDHLSKLDWPSTRLLTNCLSQSAYLAAGHSEGLLVHQWTPSNPDPRARSFCHRSIGLVAFSAGAPRLLEGRYVAIWEERGLELV